MKYIVKLTYETTVILEVAGDADKSDKELALAAEEFVHPSRMELTDYRVKLAGAGDKRSADNV